MLRGRWRLSLRRRNRLGMVRLWHGLAVISVPVVTRRTKVEGATLFFRLHGPSEDLVDEGEQSDEAHVDHGDRPASTVLSR